MSVFFKCDGCGEGVDSPKKVGFVLKRDYCSACAVTADNFLNEEEELRKATQERFVDERAAIIARYSVGNFKLPDLPT